MYSARMKDIQVRNVPDHVHAVLRQRAAAAGMSLQQYLLATLEELAARPTVQEVVARAGGRAGGRVPLSTAARDLRAERGRR